MKNKSINQVSIINGEDGPTSVFIFREAQKQSLKIRIRNAIYQSRRKRIEKRIAVNPHTLAEVVQYAKDHYDLADKKWLCILFGIPYEAEFQGEGTGSAAHVYNECGEEVLTYTEGVGWQEKETKAESQVHSALKSTYYEAFCDARKALNSEQRTGGMNENIMSQGNFDMKA